MVKSKLILNSLLNLNIALSVYEIIPSLSQLKINLINLIDLFTTSLLDEGAEQNDVIKVTNVLCKCFDYHISTITDKQTFQWKSDALTSSYRVIDPTRQRLSEELTILLRSANKSVSSAALEILYFLKTVSLDDVGVQQLCRDYPPPVKKEQPNILPAILFRRKRVYVPVPLVRFTVLQSAIMLLFICVMWLCLSHYMDDLIR